MCPSYAYPTSARLTDARNPNFVHLCATLLHFVPCVYLQEQIVFQICFTVKRYRSSVQQVLLLNHGARGTLRDHLSGRVQRDWYQRLRLQQAWWLAFTCRRFCSLRAERRRNGLQLCRNIYSGQYLANRLHEMFELSIVYFSGCSRIGENADICFPGGLCCRVSLLRLAQT